MIYFKHTHVHSNIEEEERRWRSEKKKKEEKNEKKNEGNSKFFVWIRRTAYGGDVDGVSFAGADRNAIKDKIGSKTDPLLLDLS